MTGPERSVGEDDLHAYIDRQLDASRRVAVERHLATHPDAARRVAAFQTQRDALRAAFATPPAELLPAAVDLTQIIESRQRRPRRSWLVAASVVMALSVGGIGGWFLHAPRPPARSALAVTLLKQEALTSHVVYAGDQRHPVEVFSAGQTDLQQWLSQRLKRTVTTPDLSALGFRLIGGRLLATEHGGAAALLMYEDARGQRLSLLLRPMAPDLHAPRSDMSQGTVNGCAWIESGLGYAVVAAMPDTELERVANRVRSELSARG